MNLRYMVLTVIFLANLGLNNLYGQNDSLKKEFEEIYKTWIKNKNEKYFMMASPYGGPDVEKQIISLGLDVVPLIFNKLEDNPKESRGLERYVIVFTKKLLERETKGEKPNSLIEGYINWWKEGRKETPSIFNKYCSDYEVAIKDKNEEVSKELLMKIKRLGIDALPYMIEKLKKGNEYLVPVFIDLTTVKDSEKNLKETATKEECLKWWEENKEEWLLPPVESK